MKALDILNSPWAIYPPKLAEITAVYSARAREESIDLAAIEAGLGRPLEREAQGYEIRNGVALVPIDGIIAKRMNLLTKISGGVSTELVARDVRQAAADPKVQSIVLVIDSPGGTVDGTQALAAVVAEANGKKPVVAYADGMMASAAYWIGCAADSVVLSGDTTHMGSIGVVASHIDVSRAEEQAGVKTTEIYAGKYKRIASEYAPLSEAGRNYMQSLVDELYSVFVGEVAQYRRTPLQLVLDKMADGRLFIGRQAVDAGLADRVSNLDALIAELAGGTYAARPQRAAATIAAPTIEDRCRAAWDSTPSVRQEFIHFENYLAYERARSRFQFHNSPPDTR